MKHLNKRRVTTFLFLLKKRLFGCVAKAGKRKKIYKNNADAANANNVELQHVKVPQNVELKNVEATATNVIGVQDEGDASIATCRICLECEVEEDDPLISPCMCKGSLQFVHRSCLDCWRSVKGGFDFSHCTTCKAQYHLRVLNETSWRTTKFKLFVARDIFLVFLFIQAVIGMMGCLACLADTHGSLLNHNWFRVFSRHTILFYYCVGILIIFVLLYLLGLRRAILKCYYNYNDVWMELKLQDPCCYWLPVSVDVCFRVLITIAIILMLVGILYVHGTATRAIRGIWRRHSHILIINYTQKYVVEDLEGGYSPAKLDPEEMERLKMLKLF